MRSSSPPSYSPAEAIPYPQPPPQNQTKTHTSHIQHPTFRHRKSSTYVSISSLPLERSDSGSSTASAAEEGEGTPLLGDDDRIEGTAVVGKWYQGPIFVAGVKFVILFAIFTSIVGESFYFGIPHLDPEDKQVIKLPRSFEDLQALNTLFQKYKELYPLRILACGVVTYLFVQTFTLPGSMYLSILFGAAYGMVRGLLLACLCDACGSCLCYTLSAILAPPLLALPFYRARVETWRTKIMGDPKAGKEVSWDHVFSILLVLRIAPFPPHWIPNFVAPHLGIGIGMFWLSCFIGIAPVSVIHVTIGSSLDTMTSAEDFHILSLRNILGLCAVVVAVLIPIGLKRVFRKDLGELEEAESILEQTPIDATNVIVATDEQGRPVKYQAIDSGVVLAGPSSGDPNLDTGVIGVKGKGKAGDVEIVVNGETESEPASNHNPHGLVEQANVNLEKRGVKGYGAIETVPRSMDRQDRQAGMLWPFAR